MFRYPSNEYSCLRIFLGVIDAVTVDKLVVLELQSYSQQIRFLGFLYFLP